MEASGWRTNPLWTKAPLQLFRYPKLFLALLLGVLLTSFVPAAYYMALSATANHLLDQHIEGGITRYGAGIAYWSTDVGLRAVMPGQAGTLVYRERQRVFTEASERLPNLGRPVGGVLGPTVRVSPDGHNSNVLETALFSGTDALKHVKILSGPSGEGVWLAGFVARILDVHAGDWATIRYQNGRELRIRVAGTYEALKFAPHPGYWRLWGHYIYKPCDGCPDPPPFLLLDRSHLIRLTEELGVHSAVFGWATPVRAGLRLNLDQANSLERQIRDLHAKITAPHSALHAALDCCHTYTSLGFRRHETHFSSELSFVLNEVASRTAAIIPSAQIVRLAGLLVALLVVGAAGGFSAATRRVEMALLDARGTVPLKIGARAMAEVAAPAVFGGALGVGFAALAGHFLGGRAPLSGSAIRAAFLQSGVAILGAMTLVAVVTTVMFARQARRHLYIPGGVGPLIVGGVLVALSLVILRELQAGGGYGIDPALHVKRPRVGFLLFPLLLLGGFGALAAAVVRWIAWWLRRRSDRFAPPAYLAVHRLAAATGLTAGLFAASAMCLGVFVYAQTVGTSISETVEAKAKTFVGSDISITTTTAHPTVPSRFSLPFTEVSKVPQAGTFLGGTTFDLLAITPKTFARAAYWDNGFARQPLPRLLNQLQAKSHESIPIIVSAAEVPDRLIIHMAQRRFPAHVVGRVTTFPGASSPRPLIVVNRSAIQRLYGLADPLVGAPAMTMLWVKGNPHQAELALRRAGIPSSFIVTADEVKEVPEFVASISALHVLEALGLAAGILVMGGLLMYLQSRERSQLVTFGLSRRMGLSPRNYSLSLSLELGAILLTAYLVAAGLGTGLSS
jgi:hypothetical protein